MTKPLNPSPWLLLDEPDLTRDQVWGIYAWAGQAGCRVPREGVVIADTAQQAIDAVKRHDWTPVMVINEATLHTQITRAVYRPDHVVRNLFGQAGTDRFLLVFNFNTDEPETPLRLRWVQASSEAAARSTWPELGETHAPKVVIPLAMLMALRDRVRQVRLERGVGAMSDGRQFPDRDERWFELEAQKRPGGRAELNANARELHELRLRVQAKRQKGSAP